MTTSVKASNRSAPLLLWTPGAAPTVLKSEKESTESAKEPPTCVHLHSVVGAGVGAFKRIPLHVLFLGVGALLAVCAARAPGVGTEAAPSQAPQVFKRREPNPLLPTPSSSDIHPGVPLICPPPLLLPIVLPTHTHPVCQGNPARTCVS